MKALFCICFVDGSGRPAEDYLSYREICELFKLPDVEVLKKLLRNEYRCIPLSKGCCICDDSSLFNIMVEKTEFDENGNELPW